MKKTALRHLALTLCGATLLAPAAQSATQSTTMAVAVTVPVICSIGATALNFPPSLPTVQVSATSTVSVNCPSGVVYNVTLDAGRNVAGGQRRMSNGSGVAIGYLLTKTAGGAEWGDSGLGDTHAGTPVAGTGNGSTQNLTVFGRTNPAVSPAAAPAGSYTDSIVVTVHF